MIRLLALFCALFAVGPAVSATRIYNITNNCPIPITLYVSGVPEGVLVSFGGYTTRIIDNNWSGFIYTDANQGNADGSGTVRAGFFGEVRQLLVTDPSWVNVGVSIAPIDRAPKGGFCLHADCEFGNCGSTAAFQQPPTAFPDPQSDFARRARYPTSKLGRAPSSRRDIRISALIYDCNGSQAQKWVIKRGKGSVQVAGTNYCLDAGSSPGNGVGMKIWQCFDGLAAQTWFYDGVRKTLTLYNEGQCLDLTDGDLTNSRQTQTWQCTAGNTNQLWDI
ncbi:G-X-X-X-Q-X-W domain-containing protein [Mycena latifolia]|nr:G-X-X-X-Q-X-W domain-containing protein [Mycena latifolia]